LGGGVPERKPDLKKEKIVYGGHGYGKRPKPPNGRGKGKSNDKTNTRSKDKLARRSPALYARREKDHR